MDRFMCFSLDIAVVGAYLSVGKKKSCIHIGKLEIHLVITFTVAYVRAWFPWPLSFPNIPCKDPSLFSFCCSF